MNASSRLFLTASLLLGLGFAYGVLSEKKKFFPHNTLQSLFGKQAGDTESASGGPDTPMETGWWVGTDRPSEEDVVADLDALGYGQSYQLAEDAFGVTVHDASRAQAGLNLVVSAHEPEALLTDMNGEELHSWRFAFDDVPRDDSYELPGTFGTRYFRRAHLRSGGGLLAVFDRSGLIALDKDSNLLWSLVGGYHHDLEVAADGSIWTLRHDVHVVPRVHETKPIFEDFVTRISADGEVLSEFSLLEAFERSIYASLLESLQPETSPDLFHTNSIELLDGSLAQRSPHFAQGNVLVSIWGLDTVAIVDPKAAGGPAVVWALTGLWRRQHEPLLLSTGNLLVFDNMGHAGMSKVVELDPFTQDVVWSYEGDEENDFYSALCGSNQRLANGNTLITESLSGRAFEVTPENEVVWRYLSPFRVEVEGKAGVAVLMEVVRLPAEAGQGWLN